jgi:hypothetical protein
MDIGAADYSIQASTLAFMLTIMPVGTTHVDISTAAIMEVITVDFMEHLMVEDSMGDIDNGRLDRPRV